MNKPNILICGATGFIGRNIVERLAKRSDVKVFGTYFHAKPDKTLLKNKNISLCRADLTCKRDVDRIVHGKDVIIQAAAVTSGAKDIVDKPYLHVTDNAIMNSLILRAAFEHNVKHVVFFSCTVMYPNQHTPVAEDDVTYELTDAYFGVGWTKLYIEKMCEFFSAKSRTKYTVIRHSNIYGPFDKYDLEHSHVFGATIAKVMTNTDGAITVWGNGKERRDLLYVSDLVDFVEIVLGSQKSQFELVNVGFGSSVAISDLVEKIVKASGRNVNIRFDTSKPTIKFNLSLNTQRVRKFYGWRPKITLDEGIRKTIDWHKKHYGQ